MSVNQSIKEMINSSDKDTQYLAVSMIRNDENNQFNYQTKKLINKVSLFNRIKNYSDVCKELGEDELTIKDFKSFNKKDRNKLLNYGMIKQIERLFNGNSKNNIYYPYFKKVSGGFGFFGSGSHDGGCWSAGSVGLFKDEETSNFIGKTFIKIYENLG